MAKINEYIKTGIFILVIFQIAPPILKNLEKQWKNNLEPRNKIGYINIDGAITNASFYRKHLTQYFQDFEIKAILLKIESPGGAAGSCQAIAHDIENLKKEFPKPIVTYTENMCASGGYQIAATTDHIVATGSAIVGSIGARIVPIFQFKELLAQWNIKCEEISSGKYKTALSSVSELTEDQKAMLQSISNDTYQQFIKDIASKRHLQLNKSEQWAEGKVFTGQQAYDLQLVDSIGSKTTAIKLIKKNIIPSDRDIEWITPPKKSKFESFFNSDDTESDDIDMTQTSWFDSFFGALFKQLRHQ